MLRLCLVFVAMAVVVTFADAQTICNGNQCRKAVNVQWLNADEFIEDGKPYARCDDGVFREKKAPKVEAPKLLPPTGVVKDKCANTETYTVNGRKVEKSDVVQALVGDKQQPDALVDDSAELAISVFAATPDEARKVKDELRAKLGDAGYRYWHGTPGDWAGTPAGFMTSGKPTIYCQAPSGAVLHRQDDLGGGVDAAVGAIRKAKADYDPAKDPDRRNAEASPAGGSSMFLLLAAALGVLLLMTRK